MKDYHYLGRKKRKTNNEEKNHKSSLVLYSPKIEQMLAHFGVKLALSIYSYTMNYSYFTNYRKLNSF